MNKQNNINSLEGIKAMVTKPFHHTFANTGGIESHIDKTMEMIKALLTTHEQQAESSGYEKGWEARKNSKQEKIERSKGIKKAEQQAVETSELGRKIYPDDYMDIMHIIEPVFLAGFHNKDTQTAPFEQKAVEGAVKRTAILIHHERATHERQAALTQHDYCVRELKPIWEQQARREGVDLSKITRVEVIDHTKDLEHGGGRAYVKWQDGIKVEQQLQDDNRTLKIFILEENPSA